MLLGRTANGLYWMNRYIERAENMARLRRCRPAHGADPQRPAPRRNGRSVLLSAGADEAFYERHHASSPRDTVSDFLLRDPANPSSVDVLRSRRPATMRAWCAPR